MEGLSFAQTNHYKIAAPDKLCPQRDYATDLKVFSPPRSGGEATPVGGARKTAPPFFEGALESCKIASVGAELYVARIPTTALADRNYSPGAIAQAAECLSSADIIRDYNTSETPRYRCTACIAVAV